MAEAAKLKKIQPAGEPIRWSAGAPARARFICLRPRASALTEISSAACVQKSMLRSPRRTDRTMARQSACATFTELCCTHSGEALLWYAGSLRWLWSEHPDDPVSVSR